MNMSKTLLNDSPEKSQQTPSGKIWENLTGELMIARYEKQFPELKGLPREEKIKRLLSRLRQLQAQR
jgi:hypothetical protein